MGLAPSCGARPSYERATAHIERAAPRIVDAIDWSGSRCGRRTGTPTRSCAACAATPSSRTPRALHRYCQPWLGTEGDSVRVRFRLRLRFGGNARRPVPALEQEERDEAFCPASADQADRDSSCSTIRQPRRAGRHAARNVAGSGRSGTQRVRQSLVPVAQPVPPGRPASADADVADDARGQDQHGHRGRVQ